MLLLAAARDFGAIEVLVACTVCPALLLAAAIGILGERRKAAEAARWASWEAPLRTPLPASGPQPALKSAPKQKPQPAPATSSAMCHAPPDLPAKRRVRPPRRSPVHFVTGILSLAGVKFLLDVNVSKRVALVLRENGIDVVTANEAGLRTAGDPAHIRYCARERRIWVSHDCRAKKFLRVMAHAGALLAEGGGKHENEIIRWCLLLAERGTTE